MTDRPETRRRRHGWVVVTLLAVLALVFWKLRIIDTGVNNIPSFNSGDMYAQHFPMMWYGFHWLRQGSLPLWNPHGLCGEPFVAIPYVGMFYPLNAVYLLFDVPVATELETIIHMMIGLLGMWALLRHYGASHLAGVTAAVTFAWSGWLLYNVNQPSIFSGLNWMPFTVLALDSVASGRRLAWLGLILIVAAQLLRGAGEILTHALLAGAFFVVGRLAVVISAEGLGVGLRRTFVISVAIVAGAALSAVQLLPTFELVGLSTRAGGTISFELASAGNLLLTDLLPGMLGVGSWTSVVTVGLFPVLCIALTCGTSRGRLPWLCALALLIAAVSLIPGGALFYYYHVLPFIGSLFRRPMKFLDIYTLALSVLVGLAVWRLQGWSQLPRRETWRDPAWVATIAAGVALLLWWPWPAPLSGYALASILALLVAFGSFNSAAPRAALIGAICTLHALFLFASVCNEDMRPWHRPNVYQMFPPAMRYLSRLRAYERCYVFSDPNPGVRWQLKSGMMESFNVAADYESLVAARYGSFFDLVAPTPRTLGQAFIGLYALDATSKWHLMDLTGTRYFVAQKGRLMDLFLASAANREEQPKFRLIRDGFVRVYERKDALPRAYFVGRARLLGNPEEVLRMLDTPTFDPHREVLLEDAPESLLPADSAATDAAGSAEIVSYQPEDIRITVTNRSPGYLVLSDLFYPGWKALEGERELPIYRANYLFRAVYLPPGRHQIAFLYRPASFARGLGISLATALAVLATAVIALRHRPVPTDGPPAAPA